MLKKKLSSLIPIFLLLLMGAVCLYYYLKQEVDANGVRDFILTHYVSPGFHLATLLGGLGMVVVALFLFFTSSRDAGCGHDHDEDCEGEHEHQEMNPLFSLLILCLPIGFSLFATQHAFTESELARRSELDMNPESFQQFDLPPFTLESLDEYKEKNVSGAYKMQLMELFLSAGDPTVSKVLEGVKVEVEGALRSQPGAEEQANVKRLYRMVMQCCAADMQAVPVKMMLLDGAVDHAATIKEHTWVKVEADLSYEVNQHGIKQVVLKVSSIQQATPPDTEVFLMGGGSVMRDRL